MTNNQQDNSGQDGLDSAGNLATDKELTLFGIKTSLGAWYLAAPAAGALAGGLSGLGGLLAGSILSTSTLIGLDAFIHKFTKGDYNTKEGKIVAWIIAGVVVTPAIWITSGIIKNIEIAAERNKLHERVETISGKAVNKSNYLAINREIIAVLHDACYSKVAESECLKISNDSTLLDQPHRQMLNKSLISINKEVENEKERQRLEEARRQAEAEELRRQSIADGTYQPTEFEVGRPCKELAEENSLTGRVDWGWFGMANSRWYPDSKTLVLEGRSKNAFGVKIPFKISCQWQKGGIVKVVGLSR